MKPAILIVRMEEKVYLFALSHSGLLPRKLFRLVQHFGAAQAVWEESVGKFNDWLSESEKERFKNFRKSFVISQKWEEFQRSGVKLAAFSEACYPPALKEIADPPLVLYFQGELNFVKSLLLAVVGSRNASAYGKLQARKLAESLAALGVTVVSGLARGIDMSAHQGALEGGGSTIAVLGSGLDHIYPPENENLARRIMGHGAVISEFPLGTPPNAWNFPRRNRIISGVSLGVIVIEAGAKSGALITAKFALEQGREVFALPGLPGSKTSEGSNELIQAGAKLVQEIGDVLEEFPYLSFRESSPSANPKERIEETILASLENRKPGKMIEHLAQETRLPVEQLAGVLLILETKGLVSRLPGNLYAKTKI